MSSTKNSLYKQAQALQQSGDIDAALASYKSLLARTPKHPEAICNLVQLLRQQGQTDQAYQTLKASEQYLPPDIFFQLSGLLEYTYGNISKAADFYLKAATINPSNTSAYSHYLLMLNYLPDQAPDFIFRKHRDSDLRLKNLYNIKDEMWRKYCKKKKSSKKLSIGYISEDFKRHSVAFFIEPIIALHDRSTFEVTLYSGLSKPDQITEQFKSLTDNWRDISQVPIKQASRQICDDGIDILVDLGSHTMRKLPILAHKPAPVQISYLGYPNTTGLSTIDYRITDSITDPVNQDAFYTERLVKLPTCFLCFAPPAIEPTPAAAPLLQNGYITFGSLNTLAKITPSIIQAWSAILNQTPNSRLLIKNISMGDDNIASQLTSQFASHGIARERIITKSFIQSLADHLAFYSNIDISLDTFPYNGTTTTFESLWMGVPVITMQGENHRSRVGADILTNLNLKQLCAHDMKSYIELATTLANDIKTLCNLHKILRPMLADSVLCDAKRFTSNLESLYLKLWKRFSAKNKK